MCTMLPAAAEGFGQSLLKLPPHWSVMMMSFLVQDMSCGHCVGSITSALNTADPGAEVRVDLGQHLVTINRTHLDAAALAQAIVDAGYTPQPTGPTTGPTTA
jgi:copper chaperone